MKHSIGLLAADNFTSISIGEILSVVPRIDQEDVASEIIQVHAGAAWQAIRCDVLFRS